MDSYNNRMATQFKRLLEQREAELREVLRAGAGMDQRDGETAAGEVADFKDFASESSRTVVDDVQTSRAIKELDQVLAAHRRLDQRSFGKCLDCDTAIDLRRLTALPSTALCGTCQAALERRQAHDRSNAIRP